MLIACSVTGSGTKFVNPLNVISKDISSNHHSPRLNSLFRNSISSAYRVQSNFQSLSNSRSTFDGFKAVPQEQSEQKRNLRNIRSSYCARQVSSLNTFTLDINLCYLLQNLLYYNEHKTSYYYVCVNTINQLLIIIINFISA